MAGSDPAYWCWNRTTKSTKRSRSPLHREGVSPSTPHLPQNSDTGVYCGIPGLSQSLHSGSSVLTGLVTGLPHYKFRGMARCHDSTCLVLLVILRVKPEDPGIPLCVYST